MLRYGRMPTSASRQLNKHGQTRPSCHRVLGGVSLLRVGLQQVSVVGYLHAHLHEVVPEAGDRFAAAAFSTAIITATGRVGPDGGGSCGVRNRVVAGFAVGLGGHRWPEEQIFFLTVLVLVLLATCALGRGGHNPRIMNVVTSVAVGADAGADHLLTREALLL